jgi:hypothetical protein
MDGVSRSPDTPKFVCRCPSTRRLAGITTEKLKMCSTNSEGDKVNQAAVQAL